MNVEDLLSLVILNKEPHIGCKIPR